MSHLSRLYHSTRTKVDHASLSKHGHCDYENTQALKAKPCQGIPAAVAYAVPEIVGIIHYKTIVF